MSSAVSVEPGPSSSPINYSIPDIAIYNEPTNCFGLSKASSTINTTQSSCNMDNSILPSPPLKTAQSDISCFYNASNLLQQGLLPQMALGWSYYLKRTSLQLDICPSALKSESTKQNGLLIAMSLCNNCNKSLVWTCLR